ncbi:MAG TPA: ferric reductase-like transmembrane domain-containing protein [Candidatus Limnocylindrales bacterium]|nr:ferric reductase-like transmembrane domain-containing protein [Candidatus Limnocylindrales bacterium]
MGRQYQAFTEDAAAALHSRWAVAIAVSILALIAVLPLALAIPNLVRSDDPLAVRIGVALGLLAFGLMALQIVIGSRLRLVSDPIGLGQLLGLHRLIGILVLALLLAHPLLVTVGHGKPELLNPFRAPWGVRVGQLALLLLIVHSVLAVFRTSFSIDYVVWRRIHRAAFLIFSLAFVHGFAEGDDLKRHAMQVLWVILLVGAGSLAFHAHFLKPRTLRQNRHRIMELIPETHNTTTLVLAPETGERFQYLPGQFMFLTPLEPNEPLEEHPFTISSSPAQRGVLTATIKSVGDFTAHIKDWRTGEHILVDGPHGKFSYLLHRHADRLVFIAAGVGITPLMSMIRFLRDTGDPRPIRLIYANQTETDIIFRDELEQMQNEIDLHVVHILSRPSEDWRGERGRVSREFLSRFIEEERGAAFYVCGPPLMMKSVAADLSVLQVPPDRIYSENFSL